MILIIYCAIYGIAMYADMCATEYEIYFKNILKIVCKRRCNVGGAKCHHPVSGLILWPYGKPINVIGLAVISKDSARLILQLLAELVKVLSISHLHFLVTIHSDYSIIEFTI